MRINVFAPFTVRVGGLDAYGHAFVYLFRYSLV